MEYTAFVKAITGIAMTIGRNCIPDFSNDRDSGKYIAEFPDGMVITGNSISKKATVLFGSGHQAMFAI